MTISWRSLQAYRKIRYKVKELSFPYARYEKNNKYIFIHVPKVAGTSIVWAISGSRGGRKHLPWYVYKAANPVFYDRAFKFAFVRNPWDRAVSAYVYLCRGGNGNSDSSLSGKISKYENFSDFVRNGLGEGLYRNHLLFLPQSEFIVNGDGELEVDFLGRYENLAQDCRFVFEKLGINVAGLPMKNSSRGSNRYRETYKRNGDVEVIAGLYKQDIRTFGYTF
jgi:hypothetical protein